MISHTLMVLKHNFSTSKHLPGPGPECNICHRLFRTVEGLEEHYRGSSAHPNCALCGAGSRDEPALSKHIMSYHGHPDDLVGKSTGSAFINQGVGEEMSGTIALSNRDLVVVRALSLLLLNPGLRHFIYSGRGESHISCLRWF